MWPIDSQWKRERLEDMEVQGISRSELARRIGCDTSAITVMFRPETKQSRLVPAVNRVLGRAAPSTVTASDEVLRRINSKWDSLSKAQRELVQQLVEALLAKH